MSRILYAFGIASLFLGSAGAANAHHSFAMFDTTKTVTLTGTVSKWSWANPHSFLEMTVEGAGGPQHWEIESASPAMLSRMGMSRKTLSTGEKVTVKIQPRRDGSSGGRLLSVDLPNGSTVNLGLPREDQAESRLR